MNRFLAVLAFIAVVGGAWLVLLRDPGHVPIFDANIRRLAETDREGYCAGIAFWESGGGPDAERAAECREANAAMSDTPNIQNVQLMFCKGILEAGFPGDIYTDCMSVLQGRKWWPTYDGEISDAWTKAYPYPGDLWVPPAEESRTGTRETIPREELVRP